MEHRFPALSTANQHFNVPASCPFTISQIQYSPPNPVSAWLIREHDDYGEYPHIYAKLCHASTNNNDNNDQAASVIVLSDTGCGTDVHNPNDDGDERFAQPESWSIRTFLEYTINPAGRIPYLVISTHCHYDHILGFYKLPSTDPTAHRTERNDTMESLPPPTQVLASAKGKSFITPYPNLQKHSLCSTVNRTAPQYTVSTWASDFMPVNYTCHPRSPSSPSSSSSTSPSHPSSSNVNEITIPTSLTILHTPGHTPDSLTWYDSDLRLICVADSFYTKSSSHTTHSPWGPEPPMPTIFCADSDLAAWWGAMDKILGFVREKNAELEREGEERDGFVMVNNIPDEDHASQPLQPNPTKSTFQASTSTPAPSTDPPSSFPPQSRLLLCAAHTTSHLDAETAILSIKAFIAAILRDEVPNKRADHGSGRGEERWLWDYALDVEPKMEDKDAYSVVAPMRVVERGRQTIPKEEWA